MLSYGSITVASVLKELCDVKVIDSNSYRRTYTNKQLLAEIKKYGPDIIGLNIVVANAYRSYQLIEEIKKFFPQLPIVAGGLHAYSSSMEILQKGKADIVINGEAEIPIKKLVSYFEETIPYSRPISGNALKELKKIPGVLFHDHDGQVIDTGPAEIVTNLDDLPFMDFNLANIEDYIRPGESDVYGVTSLLPTQRGCPFFCNFCKADFMAGNIRLNSPEYVVKNVERLYENYGVTNVCFSDNNFTIPKNRAIEICRLIISKGLNEKISFRCWTNVLAPIDVDLIEAFKDANFTSVQFGIERLTPEGMNAVGKVIKPEKVFWKLDLLKSHGMKVFANLLLGFPFETPETIKKETKLFKDNLHRISGFQVWATSPLPGTDLFSQAGAQKEWYLDKKYTQYEHAYFSLTFIDPMEAILLNVFQLPKETIRAIIFAKKEFFLDHNYKTIEKWYLTPFFKADIYLGLLSKWVYEKSPLLENIFFWPLKRVRSYFQRRVVEKFYNTIKEETAYWKKSSQRKLNSK